VAVRGDGALQEAGEAQTACACMAASRRIAPVGKCGVKYLTQVLRERWTARSGASLPPPRPLIRPVALDVTGASRVATGRVAPAPLARIEGEAAHFAEHQALFAAALALAMLHERVECTAARPGCPLPFQVARVTAADAVPLGACARSTPAGG
jgi:hypothetical protein